MSLLDRYICVHIAMCEAINRHNINARIYELFTSVPGNLSSMYIFIRLSIYLKELQREKDKESNRKIFLPLVSSHLADARQG